MVEATPVAFIFATNHNIRGNCNRMMTGTLTSVFPLTMCLASTNAFVLVIPKATPADSVGRRQASTSLAAPLGGDGRQVGAGGVLSRIDGNGAAEAQKKSPLKVPSAGDYTACSRSTCALHAFKGSEVRHYHTSNISLPRPSMEANIIQYVYWYSLVGDRSFWAFGPVQAYFVEIYRF